jgi:hypothetical protein
MSKFSESFASFPHSVLKNCPVPYVFKVKKVDKADGPNADTTEVIKLDSFMEPEKPEPRSKDSKPFPSSRMDIQRIGSSAQHIVFSVTLRT